MKLKILIEYTNPDSENRPKFLNWEGDFCVVGRAEANIVVNEPRCSKQHTLLYQSLTGELIVRDLGSTNGTFVNGLPITEKSIQAGEEIALGQRSKLVIIDFTPAPGPPKPMHRPVHHNLRKPTKTEPDTVTGTGVATKPKGEDTHFVDFIDEKGNPSRLSLKDWSKTLKKAA